MEAMSGELGINLRGYEFYNSDSFDGLVQFARVEGDLNASYGVSEYILWDDGRVEFLKFSCEAFSSTDFFGTSRRGKLACSLLERTEKKELRLGDPKILMAALGEKFGLFGSFNRSHENEIASKRETIGAVCGPVVESTSQPGDAGY